MVVVCIAVAVLLIIAWFIFKSRRNMKMKLKDDGQEPSIDNPVYHTTAEGNAREHPDETYTTLINPLYDAGKGTNTTYKPTDHHHSAVNGPHYDAVKKDSRVSTSTGQSTHPTSTAAYDEIKTSMDTYSVPFSPDTDTVPANQTQKGRRAGDRAAMELEGGGSEKSNTTAGHVYTVVDKKRKEGDRATEEKETELPATAGVVYAVVDKKKEAPPPLPPPYQPGD